MTEDEARAWLRARFDVPRETMLEHFVDLVTLEAAAQNLVSAASLSTIWARHIVDSAQLLALADRVPGPWVDIGSGAGFPGMVIAIISDRPVTLVEPRRKRAAFLEQTANNIGIGGRVHIAACRAEQCHTNAAVISARAVAPMPTLITAALHLSTKKTLWLLPKGKGAMEEVAATQQTWHGSFHVEHSVTDPASLIITAKGVARR
ncbi:MAG: 16S rRNA (guanine(527)-N(7))-methyltransferase RsmG [Sphingomonas sp.]|nr:16S rRNA (guanine(527)-N(7))-methyltransferase RsmG [Sphingomonas sp.]